MSENPFRDALRRAPNETWLDKLARASLEAAEAEFYPRTRSSLRVSIGESPFTADDLSSLTRSVQSATAKIGHLIRQPSTDITRALKADRLAAQLLSRAQAGGTIFFDFPEPVDDEPNQDPLADFDVRTLSERAALELVHLLPSDAEDDRSLDAALSRRRTERSALNDVVKAVYGTKQSLNVTLRISDHEEVSAGLSYAQARTLHSSLEESREETTTLRLMGTLDGMRTKRRLFYFDAEQRGDLWGAVDESMLESVRDHIGVRVQAVIERTAQVEASGIERRPTYRLLELIEAPQLFTDPPEE